MRHTYKVVAYTLGRPNLPELLPLDPWVKSCANPHYWSWINELRLQHILGLSLTCRLTRIVKHVSLEEQPVPLRVPFFGLSEWLPSPRCQHRGPRRAACAPWPSWGSSRGTGSCPSARRTGSGSRSRPPSAHGRGAPRPEPPPSVSPCSCRCCGPLALSPAGGTAAGWPWWARSCPGAQRGLWSPAGREPPASTSRPPRHRRTESSYSRVKGSVLLKEKL